MAGVNKRRQICIKWDTQYNLFVFTLSAEIIIYIARYSVTKQGTPLGKFASFP